jgi:flagellar hook-basal body complex protein FliE
MEYADCIDVLTSALSQLERVVPHLTGEEETEANEIAERLNALIDTMNEKQEDSEAAEEEAYSADDSEEKDA